MQDGFSMVKDDFENVLQRVEIFYSTSPISRYRVRLDQIIEDGQVVPLDG